MAETLEAIKAAYRSEVDRLRALDDTDFLQACLDIAPHDFGGDELLVDTLLRAGEDGSIEAAAAIQVLALAGAGEEIDRRAQDALTAVFCRNIAAREEMLKAELIRMVEEAAVEMGLERFTDPADGVEKWRHPKGSA